MRHGGGTAGNLAPNNLSAISHPNLKAIQPVATTGGEDADGTQPLPGALPIVPWPPSELADRLLPVVGAPVRTDEDAAVLARTDAALRALR